MNPYQKSAALVLRFVGLGLIAYGLVQLAFWFVVYSTIIGGSQTFTSFFPVVQMVDTGILQSQAFVAVFTTVIGVLLMLVSKPLGRALGRGLDS